MDLALIFMGLGSILFFLGLVSMLITIFQSPTTAKEMETMENIGMVAMTLILLGVILFVIGLVCVIV